MDEVQLADVSQQHEESQRQVQAAPPAKPAPPAEPTFHDFGKRIGRILAMAEEEAEEMRNAAVAEVRERLEEADKLAATTREEADSYADRIVLMARGRIVADGPATEQLDSVLIRPKKADIDVTLVTLAFAPHWQDAGGTLTPAF